MASIELHPDFRKFLRSLNSHGVEYRIRSRCFRILSHAR
jgi:hypothetical protein